MQPSEEKFISILLRLTSKAEDFCRMKGMNMKNLGCFRVQFFSLFLEDVLVFALVVELSVLSVADCGVGCEGMHSPSLLGLMSCCSLRFQ